jgi:hypothetical protein
MTTTFGTHEGFDFPASGDRMKVFTRKKPARVIPGPAKIR